MLDRSHRLSLLQLRINRWVGRGWWRVRRVWWGTTWVWWGIGWAWWVISWAWCWTTSTSCWGWWVITIVLGRFSPLTTHNDSINSLACPKLHQIYLGGGNETKKTTDQFKWQMWHIDSMQCQFGHNSFWSGLNSQLLKSSYAQQNYVHQNKVTGQTIMLHYMNNLWLVSSSFLLSRKSLSNVFCWSSSMNLGPDCSLAATATAMTVTVMSC